jgi:hypothetical protein
VGDMGVIWKSNGGVDQYVNMYIENELQMKQKRVIKQELHVQNQITMSKAK